MTEMIRNITSGDQVDVEFKGEAQFSTKMYLKLIIGSNHEPEITSGGADKSRLIRIHVSENINKKDDPEWPERLKQELPAFLHACREQYEKLCPNHGKIILDKQIIDDVDSSTEAIEAHLEAIIERRIEFSPEYKTSVTEWVDFYTEENLSNLEVGNLKDYLKRQHGYVQMGRKIVEGKKVCFYDGFKVRRTSKIDEKRNEENLNELRFT